MNLKSVKRKLAERLDTDPEHKGGTSRVYIIDDVAAKVYNMECSYQGKREYELGEKLRKDGVHLPEYYEVCYIDQYTVLLMQEIKGRHADNIQSHRLELFKEGFKKEILKVLDIGYFPEHYAYVWNSLFTSRNKVYLLDVAGYFECKNSELIERTRERMKRERIFLSNEDGRISL